MRTSRRAERVWGRLTSWYGARLAEQYGSKPPEDWRELIDRTDDARLEAGLINVRRASPVHPPTLGQLEEAIPAKRIGPSGESIAKQLNDFVLQHRSLCEHQIAKNWNYFGPVEELASKHRGSEIVSHPVIHGVQIPACMLCERPSLRVLQENLRSEGVTAG